MRLVFDLPSVLKAAQTDTLTKLICTKLEEINTPSVVDYWIKPSIIAEVREMIMTLVLLSELKNKEGVTVTVDVEGITSAEAAIKNRVEKTKFPITEVRLV